MGTEFVSEPMPASVHQPKTSSRSVSAARTRDKRPVVLAILSHLHREPKGPLQPRAGGGVGLCPEVPTVTHPSSAAASRTPQTTPSTRPAVDITWAAKGGIA